MNHKNTSYLNNLGVGVIIQDNGKIFTEVENEEDNLIQKNKGDISIPMGHVNLGEDMIETGSLQYSIWLARLMLTRSTHALTKNKHNIKMNKEALEFLVGINDYMYKRDLTNTD